MSINILSRASEAGSPTNRPGSDKTRGQGSFGPSTGGPDLTWLFSTYGLIPIHSQLEIIEWTGQFHGHGAAVEILCPMKEFCLTLEL